MTSIGAGRKPSSIDRPILISGNLGITLLPISQPYLMGQEWAS